MPAFFKIPVIFLNSRHFSEFVNSHWHFFPQNCLDRSHISLGQPFPHRLTHSLQRSIGPLSICSQDDLEEELFYQSIFGHLQLLLGVLQSSDIYRLVKKSFVFFKAFLTIFIVHNSTAKLQKHFGKFFLSSSISILMTK